MFLKGFFIIRGALYLNVILLVHTSEASTLELVLKEFHFSCKQATLQFWLVSLVIRKTFMLSGTSNICVAIKLPTEGVLTCNRHVRMVTGQILTD